MFEFLRNLLGFGPKYQNLGALIPSEKELEDLPKFEEVVAMANAVDWKPLDPARFNYKVRNQSKSSGCVAFTRASIWSVMYFMLTGLWVDFSAKWPYFQRTNKPEEGMYGQDVLEVGMIPEELMPSDNLNEAQMNDGQARPWLLSIAQNFLMATPIILPLRDIEKIASVIQTTGKPVQIFLRFGPNEWFGQFIPKIIANLLPWGHSVMAYDYGIYNGKKSIIILDSAHSNADRADGKRIVTEDFYSKRNVFAQYFMRFKFEDGTGKKPHYDGSVASLQDCLTYDGVFPSNVTNRGVLGPITVEAIKKFQAKYDIIVTGTVGPITTKKLKALFK